jgi:hypothetical protein
MAISEWGAQPPVEIDAGYAWEFVAAWCNDDRTKVDPTGWTARLLWVDDAAEPITDSPAIVVDDSYILTDGPDTGQGTWTVTVRVGEAYTSTLTFPRGSFRIAIAGPDAADDLFLEVPVTINQGPS